MILLAAALSLAVDGAPLLRQRHDLALSPNGDRIAAVEVDQTGLEQQAPHGRIVVRSSRDGAVLATLDPCPTCNYTGLAWSAQGAALAFVASVPGEHTGRVEVAEGTAARTVAAVDGVVERPQFSPDGKTLAFLATPGARKQPGAVQAGVPLVGEIGEINDEQRIAIAPASGGPTRLVSPSDTYVYEYAWTPDGRGFVATSAKGNGDNNWWVAKLVAYDLGGRERVIAAPPLQMNAPSVSPDGRTVAVIGGLMSDFGSVGGDVYTVPLSGGELKDITPGYKGSFTGLTWTRAGLMATALVADRAAEVGFAGPAMAARTLWSAAVSLSVGRGLSASFSDDGTRSAGVIQDFEHPPELASGPLGRLEPITHDNASARPQVSARSVTWTNEDQQVQGWLLGPRTLEPGRAHPMIVQIHGGPAAAVTPAFVSSGLNTELIARGYYVFLPNPRGSYGQGEAFTRGNVRDFGGGDLRDILAGIDAVEKIAPIDDQRLGVTGGSYGGFMTMWTVTHTHRFKAAVAGAGISDWISYYGENGIDQWMIPYFGASAYDDPAIYVRLSPLTTIKSAITPTFIWVGERDVECPPPQSQEFWHALKEFNVPTSLVIYPGEGHGVRKPQNVRDLDARTLAWWKRYLGS